MLVTRTRVALVMDLTQHLTTRAGDSHAAPVSEFPKAPIHLWKVLSMSRPGKVLRVGFELNHMLHRCAGPVNSFEF